MPNVSTLLEGAAGRHPDRPAVRYGEQRLTYAALDERASRFGSALLARGLRPGDAVALFAKNRAEYVVAMFGAFKAGLTIVPVNAKLAGAELEVILRDSAARALVYDAGSAETAAQAVAAAPVEVVVRTGDAFEALLAEGDPSMASADVGDDAVAWLFYTSGTTGRPKGAELTHRNLLAMTWLELCDICDFRADDIVLHVAPLSHGSGLYMLGAIARAAENLIYDRASFDPADVIGLIERERVTVIGFLAPTMIVMLLDADPDATLPSVRRAVYGGAPISRTHAERMVERFGTRFVQIYGQGETPMTITFLDLAAESAVDAEVLSSAGIPHPGVEVRLLGPDDQLVEDGREGEICVRGDTVMRGYRGNPGATAETLRGGWLHTGDIGRFDDAGRLLLLDRSKDVIISGGTNIYPREVEEALMKHPAVAEVVVFGEPDELWGESVTAVVVAGPGEPPSERDLIWFCKEHLASFKKPKRVMFVEQLPRNATGKVLRGAIKDRLRAAVGEAGS
ncbi:MAG TPA: AMP-binding protein [Solirubrobacteraceae bacterium]|nr:AMP-binding protein [Solirubrobacteraceae bacterium]